MRASLNAEPPESEYPSMETTVLVAAHLSSLFPPSQATSAVLDTAQKNTPFPPATTESETPTEHATYSEFFYTPTAGTILLRIIHGGLILELVSLTHDVPPLRFVFPATILPHPAIVQWSSQELHIIAVTSTGSLYRVLLPIHESGPLWQNPALTGRGWFREYVLKAPENIKDALVHVQSTHSVVIGKPDGDLLRLDVVQFGNDVEDDRWSETISYHASFLNSLTSFLHSETPGGAAIVSMASLPQPTDIGHVWTLSRDRMLRLWTVARGCVSAKTLSPTFPGRKVTNAPASVSGTPKGSVLLHDTPQKLLCAFTLGEDTPYVLAFIPTETSPTSGGYFQLFHSNADSLEPVNTFESSENSVHCHLQNFVVVGNTLHLLWDRQGQSMVERAELHLSRLRDAEVQWQVGAYHQEAELTPAYLDELLLSPGSLTDKYFEAIMRPGMFSPHTLHTAINQYTDACLALPGTPPPQLLSTYATDGENIAAVVGCTVCLTKDPQTGAQQYDNYWNALKRDWEGFIARCREIERSARWPLAIGIGDPKGDVMIAERERIGSAVTEDLPIRLHRLLSLSNPLEPQFALLEILWTLRSKLGPRSMLSLENRLTDIVQQEIAFPYADIIQDQAQRSSFRDELDEGLDSWITGRLQSVGDIEAATRFVLDVVGGCDKSVKREEEEVELLLPPANLEWTRALTASYAANTINARYDLCLSVVTLLFFLSEDLPQWDPSLLAEIFVVFRGVAMLRHASHQPAGDSNLPLAEAGAEEDVITKMRNMNVSPGRARYTPSSSLIHRLLTQAGYPASLPTTAHHFLDSTGLLQSLSPAHATKSEVLFCERLRLLGYREAAREALAWLPRTPGVTYVLARLWLDESRYEDAASSLESLAGSFGIDNALSYEDREALAAVLPGAELFDTEFNFYLHVAGLFKACAVISYEVSFSQLALSVAPFGINTASIWYAVIKGLTDLGLYEDAYTALIASPYDKLKRECVSQLVYRMCEEHAVDRLMSLNFVGFADEVEGALSFKARNADPRVRPFYSRILYTWYVSRGDFRNAALTMYQRARKLANLSSNPAGFVEVAAHQLEAYVVSINALSLVDKQSAWLLLPVTTESENEPRKRRKLSKHIPDSKFASGKRDAEIVELADVQYEFALLSARLELIRKEPTLLTAGDLLLSPEWVVLKLAQSNRFNTAIATAKTLDVDMSDLFAHLTTQCLRLARDPDSVLGEDTSDWLLTDKVSSWPGTSAERGWRYLRQSLEIHDGPHTEYRYSKVTLETILSHDRTAPPPPWLINTLEEHHPEYLIRVYLRYDVLEAALEHALSMMRKSDARLAQEQPRPVSSTWLPYTLIDQVLLAADSQELSPRCRALQAELRAEISNRLKRMRKLSQLSQ